MTKYIYLLIISSTYFITFSLILVGSEGVLRKRITRDLQDSASSMSQHVEWYCFLYDMNYHPACAFSMEIQWLVASGSRIGDNVSIEMSFSIKI